MTGTRQTEFRRSHGGAPGALACVNADGLIACKAMPRRIGGPGGRRGELTGQPVTAREWMAAPTAMAGVCSSREGDIRVQDLGG
jgi:hypothetical protein